VRRNAGFDGDDLGMGGVVPPREEDDVGIVDIEDVAGQEVVP
jgi:hypothetical protein